MRVIRKNNTKKRYYIAQGLDIKNKLRSLTPEEHKVSIFKCFWLKYDELRVEGVDPKTSIVTVRCIRDDEYAAWDVETKRFVFNADVSEISSRCRCHCLNRLPGDHAFSDAVEYWETDMSKFTLPAFHYSCANSDWDAMRQALVVFLRNHSVPEDKYELLVSYPCSIDDRVFIHNWETTRSLMLLKRGYAIVDENKELCVLDSSAFEHRYIIWG